MATYRDIANYVIQNYGYTPKTCWIAHVKDLYGLTRGRSPNRISDQFKCPCPPEKIPHITKALKN